jgi:WD40 repeat protein
MQQIKTSLLLLLLLSTTIVLSQKEERKISATHTGNITSLAISFDGSRALTAGSDARANMWNTLTGGKLKGFAAQDKEITDVEFNSDEALFATASKNMSIVVWDAIMQKPKKILKTTAEVLALDFHPFNNQLVSIDAGGSIKLWDANAGKVLNENLAIINEKQVSNAAVKFTHDGKYFVIQANEKLYVFRQNDNKLATVFTVAKNNFGKRSFDISSDGKLLAYKNETAHIVIANIGTGTTVESISGDFKSSTFIAFAQNPQLLFIGYESGKVQLYNIASKKVVKEFQAHEKAVLNGMISLNGNVLITVGAELSLKRWDISELNLAYCQTPDGCSKSAAISSLMLNDENQNGLIDGGEKASLNISIKNMEKAALYDVVAKLSTDTKIDGLEFPSEVLVGNMLPEAAKTIAVQVTTTPKFSQGSAQLTADVIVAGTKLASKQITLQAGSSSNAGVTVSSYKFYSPSGKASKGEPLTLLVYLENVTRIAAENITVTYQFPIGVNAIDKTKEIIPSLGASQKASFSVQFIADKNFAADSITIGIDISGVSYTNTDGLRMSLPLNKEIGTQQDMLAMLETNYEQKSRGSLVVSKADIPSASVESGRYVALIIGIDNYQGTWTKLNNAVNDAKAIEDVLKKQYNFTLVKSLYNEQATRQGIISQLEWMVENLKTNDNLLIFYSGHGDFKTSLNRGFWVPVDATTNSTSNLISNPDLQTFLGSIKSRHTLLVSDACFSGDIFRGGEQKAEKAVNEKYYNRVNSLMSRQALTSGGIEPVMDGGRDGHSVFTYYLLKSLKENQQKFIDAEQLFDVIKIPVVNNSNQAPKFSHIKNTGDEGGEFIFYKK